MPIDVKKLHRGIDKMLPIVRVIADRTNSADDNELVEFLEVVRKLNATDLAPLQFEPPDDT